MRSEYYVQWDEYKEKYPILEGLDDVCTVGAYQEEIYRFVFDLFL